MNRAGLAGQAAAVREPIASPAMHGESKPAMANNSQCRRRGRRGWLFQSQPGSEQCGRRGRRGRLRQSQPGPEQRGRRGRRGRLRQPQPGSETIPGRRRSRGAGYANRNQGLNYPGAAGAAVGAGYANRNQYDQYHPGMAGGYGYGNYGYAGGTGAGYGGYGGRASGPGAWARRCTAGVTRPTTMPTTVFPSSVAGQVAAPTQARAAAAYDYSQPISTTAAPPAEPVAAQAGAGFDQARDAFKQGNYAQAVQLDQQALGQMPNDPNLHEFLALGLFAQGQYDQAASPLYAVLSVGPGWNWTTLIGMYPDADTYTQQLRALEATSRRTPSRPPAHFVLGYHYVTQGHNEAAAKQFGEAAAAQAGRQALGAARRPPAAPRQPAAVRRRSGLAPGDRPRRIGLAGKAGREPGPPRRPRIPGSRSRSRTTAASPGP